MIAFALVASMILLLSFFSFFAFYNYLYGFASLFKRKFDRVKNISGKKVAVTIVSLDERYVLKDTIEACERLTYENKVIVVTNDSKSAEDTDTIKMLRAMAVERGCKKLENHPFFYNAKVGRGKKKKNFTAPIEIWESDKFVLLHKKTNHGFKAGGIKGVEQYLNARGIEYMYLMDADWHPQPDLLERALEVLEADKRLAFVQTARLTRPRPRPILEHYITLNEEGCYYVDLPGRQAIGDPILYTGCCTLFRMKALNQVGGFTPGHLTEDIDLTNRFWLAGWKSVYLENLKNWGEVPPSYQSLRRQQERWAIGTAKALKDYFWRIVESPFLSVKEKLAIIRQNAYFTTPVVTELSILLATFTLLWLMFSSNVFEKELYLYLVTKYSLPLMLVIFLALFSNFVPLIITSIKKKAYHELIYIPHAMWYSWSLLHTYVQANIRGFIGSKKGWSLTPKLNGKRFIDRHNFSSLLMKSVNGLSLAVLVLFYIYEARLLGWFDLFVLFWVPAFVIATVK